MSEEAICHHPSVSQTSDRTPYDEGVKATLRAIDQVLDSGTRRYEGEDRERFVSGVGEGASMVWGRISDQDG